MAVFGSAFDSYKAPLFLAWQLTNRCNGSCVACCEDSGPGRAWPDELDAEEARDLARRIVAADVSYVAFGGGEPLGVPHFWDLLEILAKADVAIKIETDGRHIDARNADRLAALAVSCVQISVDGAIAATHGRVRPGSSFDAAIGAIGRLVERGLPPQLVFVPTRLNLTEIVSAYELAASLGCESFVTGPMMRLGRAAAAWDSLSCAEEDWRHAIQELEARRESLGSHTRLSIYRWDILEELSRRLESPQAMMLIVPNGKVKLLNALPFAPADLRRMSLEESWLAYRKAWTAPEVRSFINACQRDPALLGHANEVWPIAGI